MQNPSTGEMHDPEVFRKELENVEQTAARLGFPLWRVGEVVTLKGVRWSVHEIHPGQKELVLRYHSKAAGIAGMMERIAGQAP